MAPRSVESRPLAVALLGTRGIPARYGGFETFAEELAVRLAQRGHRVVVYVRKHYACHSGEVYRGVNLRVLPAVRSKHLETISHTALAMVDVLAGDPDVVLVCNGVNACLTWLPRLRGIPVVLNVDGIERKRKKWGRFGKLMYALNERLACRLPTRVVADAGTIQEYYRERYGLETVLIAYGAEVGKERGTAALERLGLSPDGYFLYVSRLEPENNAHLVIEAFRRTEQELPLVVVGDAPYSPKYKRLLQELARGGNVRLPGAIYGRPYRELLSHCRGYFHATEVGGTHPALLEAMGAGARIVVHDTPENREVAEGCGILCNFYRTEELAAWMRRLQAAPGEWDPFVRAAQERVRNRYDWERVADQYEELFYGLVG